ncbi:MAG: hypothetical protein IMZ62_06620 [Chloroflexi bacterium]|nr:hypothetical protein [Chloroflexota bacterium]
MKERFQDIDLRGARLAAAESADAILNEYAAGGWILTLRQLYYQFVARGLLANTERNYKWLGSVVNDGRLAGLLDWDHMTDRTRTCRTVTTWDSPQDIIHAAIDSYRIDLWKNQPYRIEVWVEKDALIDVVGRAAKMWQLPYFSCRGYCSQSAMRDAAHRIETYIDEGQDPCILYFGDHDPSGIDMGRDIQDRLRMFLHDPPLQFFRLALTMEQIEQYSPPPNPAKLSDSRCQGYIANYGDESWELDALEPDTIVSLITEKVDELKDPDLWEEMVAVQDRDLKKLKQLLGRLK